MLSGGGLKKKTDTGLEKLAIVAILPVQYHEET
jgi:hypothetical protein